MAPSVAETAPPPRGAASVRWLVWLPAIVAAVVAAGLLASRAGYVPMWDGRWYAECVVDFASGPPAAVLKRCALHPSQAYIGLLALVQRLDVGNAGLLLATDVALFAVLAAALARLLRSVLPSPAVAADRAWLVAILLVHPVLLASVVQPNPDLGVCVYLVCAMAAAVERRVWWTMAFGLLATFSKEAGAIAYVIVAAMYALTVGLRGSIAPRLRNALLAGAALTLTLGRLSGLVERYGGRSVTTRWGIVAIVAGSLVACLAAPRPQPLRAALPSLWRWLRPLLPLALPPVLFGAYLLTLRLLHPTVDLLWGGENVRGVVVTLIDPQMGLAARSYLALLFVLGFLWLPSTIVAADVLVGAWRTVRRAPPRPVPGSAVGPLHFVVLTTVCLAFVLTRYPTFANPRYLLPAYALMIVVFGVALLRLRVPPRARHVVLGATTVLLAVSAVRTVDPVSRALWGVFSVGREDMLRMTSLPRECCGNGRDQLAYNLQFTGIADVVDAALMRVGAPPRDTRLAFGSQAAWFLPKRVDARHRRTLRPGYPEPPALVVAESTPTDSVLPRCLWYIGLPNKDDAVAFRTLAPLYERGAPDSVWAGGFVATIHPMVRRTERGTAATRPCDPRAAP